MDRVHALRFVLNVEMALNTFQDRRVPGTYSIL
jgi:hypothetical protein